MFQQIDGTGLRVNMKELVVIIVPMAFVSYFITLHSEIIEMDAKAIKVDQSYVVEYTTKLKG